MLAVLVSAVASTQTTILPAARGTLAMGVYRALSRGSRRCTRGTSRRRSRRSSSAAVAIAIYVALSLLGENVYGDVLLAIGLMIAFYYGITAYACVWYFRGDIRRGGKDAVGQGRPAAAGRADADVRVLQERDRHARRRLRLRRRLDRPRLGWEIGSVFLFGMGTILLGLPVMFLLSRRAEQKPFFAGETLHHDTPVKAPE